LIVVPASVPPEETISTPPERLTEKELSDLSGL